MEPYEFEGKNAEEAIDNASRELHLPVEDLNVEIIEPGSAGIFGLVGGKKTKIRVSFKGALRAAGEEKGVEIARGALRAAGEEKGVEIAREALRAAGEEKGVEIARETLRASDEEKGVEIAQEALEKILSLIPVETTIKANQIDGKITLCIEGDKSGLLIGRKGKTLDALQYIVNKIVNKALDSKTNIVVDSENYRKRREESLVQLALKMGDKAKKIRKPVSTNLLNPHDRRIVHLALKEDEGLDTRSRGDGLMKKVVIIPKR
jgi:spoIIIJ-associated protein